ncbi:hypothetical protein [Streptomyces sp. NPDC056982]|uniref:hypothetical protein n=1 Tax=Streptomyces sp. NPDC056982 TaxID=3345986 RepID=UPI00362D39A4
MNRRLRRALAIGALTAAALTAPTLLAGGAGTAVRADTAWGNPPADGGTTITTPALPVPVTGSVTVTVPPVGPLDTAWG